MTKDAILAVDQGTTNTKAVLMDRAGVPVFRVSSPVGLRSPQAGFVEQDASLLWQSVMRVMRSCVEHGREQGYRIEGIAISNQRETAVAWRAGRTPVPVMAAISWQCRRSGALCDMLTPHHATIRSLTGLPVDPLASAGKWAWMLEHLPGLRAEVLHGEVLLGNVDAWLLSNLTMGGVHGTDHSNASRTGLFSLEQMDWSDEVCGLFGVPRAGLPVVQQSSSTFGVCSAIPELAGVPIVAMIGDSHAALIGHGNLEAGAVKATYGTGSSLMMLSGQLPAESATLARTIAWSDAEGVRFALEGNIAMTGSAVQWVGEFLGLQDPVDDTVALAATVADAAGLRFVPAMVGLGAPYWDTQARGLISNLTTSHRAAHLARAALDAIAFQVADVLFTMERESSTEVRALRVDGGATRNATLMQIQADLLGKPVLRSATEELSALGAARLGGLTLGWYSSAESFAELEGAGCEFNPSEESGRTGFYASWKAAVARARMTACEACA